jgi:uncharacterized SAM-binding protein YcdF (DUF218 family)
VRGIRALGAAPASLGRRFRVAAIIAALILAAGSFVFVQVGRWLVIEDPLKRADAIAVLSGRMPSRALEAARIYKQGYALEVWLTHSIEPGATLQALSITFVGEDTYDKQILMHEGVPENAIRVLEPPIVNTVDEIDTISKSLQARNGQTVIIVTSRVHTRRTKMLWKLQAAQKGDALIRGVSDDSFNSARWWSNTNDALDVVREVLGIANAWAGLPLRPAN